MVSSIDLYNRALEIDPTDYKTSLDYSFIYYESGDIEKAIKLLKIVLKKSLVSLYYTIDLLFI